MAVMDEAGLWKLASGNGGIFTRREAHSFGASPKRLRNWEAKGLIEEVLDDIFRLTAVPLTWWSRMYSATTWATPAVASHRAAAALWGLDGFRHPPVEITTERRVHEPSSDIKIHYVPQLYPSLIRSRDRIPVTSVEQTIANLGGVCPVGKVAQGLDDALRQRLTSLERLAEHLTDHSRQGRSGMGLLRHLLRERLDDGYTESRFERALFVMIRRFNLPSPTKQHQVHLGSRTFRIDFAYVPHKIAIEALSYTHHSLRDDWERDQVRNNLLTLAGWKMLYITYRRLKSDPAGVALQIKEAHSLFSSPGEAL